MAETSSYTPLESPHRTTITRSYKFSAAHRLHTEQLPVDVNQKIFGKCNNANGHGHNYTVHVTVEGTLNPQTGLIADVDRMDRIVKDQIVDRFDHQHLNFDPAFAQVVTTGENLAKLIWEILVSCIPDGRLVKVGVVETRDNFFEYCGDSL